MVDYQTISIVFTGLSISLAAFYYISTLRNSQRNQELALKAQQQQLETRQAQLFMQIYNQWNTTEFGLQYEKCMSMDWTDYEDFENIYMNNAEEVNRFRMIARFFEGVGVLVHRDLIDVTLVDDLFSGEMTRFWEKFEPMVKEIRVRWGWPQSLEWTEYLHKEIRAIMEKQHPELAP